MSLHSPANIPVFDGEDRARVIRKGDLDDAKADLRREMRLTIMAGSAVGSTIAGLVGIGASVATGSSPSEAAAAILSVLPF